MTRYSFYRNWPIPEYKEKPYDGTIVPGTIAAIDADVNTLFGNVTNVYADIGTVSAPGELRQNAGSAAGVVALARGFSSLNDGGGGYFIWVVGSTTDDGGTKIVPGGTPGGYWQRLFDGATYRNKWFGMSSIAPNNAAILNSLIATIGSNNARIVIQQDEGVVNTDYVIAVNVTVPSNIIIEIERGARFSVSSTYTMTFNGVVDAGPYQIFTGAGDAVFGSGIGWGDWWGDDLNTAVNSGLSYVQLLDRVYAPTTTISIPSTMNVKGIQGDDGGGTGGTIIRPTSAVSKAIVMDNIENVDMDYFQLDMANMTVDHSYGPVTTISFTTAADGGTITDSASGMGSFAVGDTVGVTGSTSNDGTYVVSAAAAGSLTVKGVSMTTESLGDSITLRAGPYGIHYKGTKRCTTRSVRIYAPATSNDGIVGWYVTGNIDALGSSYYNLWLQCGAKIPTAKKGIGYCAAAIGSGAVTNNTFVQCPSNAWDICWMMCTTGSGFGLTGCNGEAAGSWGIYVTDVPSATATAVKVKNGEWHSCDAGEIEALLMEDTTVNNTVGDNVTQINLGRVFNDYVRADFYVDEEKIYNSYGAGAIISPESGHMRVSGASGAITCDTTTPIAAGMRGQKLRLIGDSNTNIVTILNQGNIQMSQDRWYGRLEATLTLFYSTTSSKWIEISRTEPNPFTIRTTNNAFFTIRTDEIELDLSVSTQWAAAIPVGAEVKAVTTYVTQAITGAGVTGYSVGRGGDPNHWGDITGITVGTKSFPYDFTDRTRYIATAGQNIDITAIGGTFTGGKVRIALIYFEMDPPDS